MIDYILLGKSTEYYKDKGYIRIETPWTVSDKVDDITRPVDRIHMQLKHNDKCLVASGEQSFLYLYAKDFLPKGRFQTITPCWRYEAYDGTHSKCFMKNELIITDEVNKSTLEKIIDDANGFFSQYLSTDIIKTDIGYDIVSHVDKYELGSYGIRHCDFIDWVYGTGCAEPRLTRVIKYVNNKASEIYGE